MADGSFRRKSGFTTVQNSVARDKNISMKAKGLYLIIQSYITMPDKEWHKNDFTNMVAEGKSAFDSAWKELKDAGYLKVYIYSNGKGTRREYELLDEAKDGPSEIYVRANSGADTSEIIENTGFVQLPENQVPGNQVPGIQGLGNQEHGNQESGIYINTKVLDFKENNKDLINNTFNNNHLLPQTETVTTKAESVKPDMFEEEEEKIKKQISYDRLIRRHCDSDNKKLLTFIVHQMTDMILDPGSMVKISTNHSEPKVKVIERLNSITYDDIENLLYMLPDKKENYIKNPVGYMRNCLFNIVDRRGAICYTNQIKNKGNNQGLIHQEYDFDEMERMLGI